MSGSFLFVLLGGIIGSELAPSPAWATLPVSVLILGVAANVLPTGFLTRRFGRRAVCVGSALVAAGGCVAAGAAISASNFTAFCAAAFLLGANNAVVMQYRFAAVEYVPLSRASHAIAIVMSGAFVAAWLGPEIAVRAADFVPGARHAGSFYAGGLLYLMAALTLATIGGSKPVATVDAEPTRPLGEIAAQPAFRVAVLAALVSYAVMSFIMTATPISMHVMDGHDAVATARVIQVHLLAMYLPSLVTGVLIARFGERSMMAAGAVLMAGCVAIAAAAGHAVLHYSWALGILGLGWNLMFIAATTMLTRTYRPQERIQAQTLNDFLVFGAQAMASLMAGLALATIGWRQLNLVTLPAIAAVLVALALTARTRRPVGA